MSQRRFVPFHVHSHYSLLEGVDGLDALLVRAAACGYPALALTDSNNLYGAVPFVEAARRHGVRPILGACLRHERQRCTVLIAEPAGYASLCRVISRLNLVGREQGAGGSFPPSPPSPLPQRRRGGNSLPTAHCSLPTVLSANADGLHVLVDDATLAEVLREAFGPRLWLEVVRPARSAAQERVLLELGQRLGLRPVAGLAAHFTTPEGHDTLRLLTAVRRGILLDQVPAELPITPAHHLVDAETLCRRFRDLPEALVNTERLAEQCRSDVLPRGLVLPPARVPKAHDAAGYLRLLSERGLRRRFPSPLPLSPKGRGMQTETPLAPLGGEGMGVRGGRQRLEQELHIINQRDLAGYFLVVRDIAREARRRGFSMALRGSAGNSLVCYLLGITDVDPLRFDLPLERFLHAGRPDLPDIDLDFDWKVRDQIIALVFERYGAAHTAMISSHLFLQPRSAFREAAKVHGLSNEQISRLLASVGSEQWAVSSEGEERTAGVTFKPDRVSGFPRPTAHCPLPTGFPLEPARWPRLLADARRLLGRPHHLSIHPGGVVITPQPIENYVPLQRAAKGVVITQFEKDAVEHIGLVKIDLLGNRALSTVGEARRLVADFPLTPSPSPTQGRGEQGTAGINPAARTASPPSPLVGEGGRRGEGVLQLLRRGDTLGINQFESPAMRHLLIQMQPRDLLDVIQALALIRPGAASIGAKERFIRRRRGLEPVRYPHPVLEPLLKDTCGLMLYEDDALRVVQALAGFSAPEADRFRKQVTQCESTEEATALSKAFLAACRQNGVSLEVAAEMWVQLAKFNSYSFCKSHAVSYGLIAWEAAALKARQPLCFWVAALNNNQGMYPRRVYVEAAKRAGIPFCLPCVNRSQREFSPSPLVGEGRTGIRTGFSVIRSLDEATREAILEDRARRGPFANLADFRRRVPIGIETLALLIQVGAFDCTGQPRTALMLEAELDRVRGSGSGVQGPGLELFLGEEAKERWSHDSEPRTLNPEPAAWLPAAYPQARQWQEEWERLGFLVGPPLLALYRPFLPPGLQDSRALPSLVGRTIRLAGLVATARHTPTKHGAEMQFITLEDEWGLIETTLFPGTCSPVAYLGMGPYLVQGKVEEQYGVVTVTATRFERGW